MSPIDPVTPVTHAKASPLPPAAPPYVNEEPNLVMVRQGLDEAEDETREAVAGLYEEKARRSDDPEEALDDIDFSEGEGESDPLPPELAAMHEEFIPEEELASGLE
jgi:hypothetical protein